VQIGDILNHMFEVKRFIARGGMGEVYEGINISSDERVAIKLMLPALTQDANVQAMFRKEARTLTKLNHPALVQYRVLAQEPKLGLLYIVTEYIDGCNLCDVLGTLKPTPGELRGLALRLADGLRVAHSLGAIHRDVSPDNVLLEGGRIDRAKIIDFGIAKDLDPGSKTIVGEGFAGKLNYVAPEQLGDFGREVGAWSDIYSLGLVLLAVAQGKDVSMGATLVDAVDRRRAGPDLSPAPDELRPVLERMLKANPAERFRSMEEVITALDAPVPAGAKSATTARSPAAPAAGASSASAGGKPKKQLLIAGGAAAALALIGGSYFALSGGEEEAQAPVAVQEQVAAGAAAGPAQLSPQAARETVNGILASVGCSWLNISNISISPAGLDLTLRGVTDSPGRAQGAIARELSAKGIQAREINSEGVATVPGGMCGALDAYRSIRVAEPSRLSAYQPDFEMTKGEDGVSRAEVLLRVDIGPPPNDVAFIGLQDGGAIDPIVTSRGEFQTIAEGEGWRREGPNVWRPSVLVDHKGWSAFFMITGKGPLDKQLLAPTESARSSQWARKFADAAQRGGWKGEMVWFRTKDDQPD
jgi:serine/threonine-protein kinase